MASDVELNEEQSRGGAATAASGSFDSETRAVLGVPAGVRLTFEPIEKGGSDRTFHRVAMDGSPIAILMHYGTEREENRLFVGIARYLESIGVPVPHIMANNDGLRLVWLEDLGSVDLCALGAEPWSIRSVAYARVLEAIAELHRRDPAEPSQRGVGLSPGFDARLYHWEHQYFLENFVERICGIPSAEARDLVSGDLDAISGELLSAPRALIHRDFQSQNIMVHEPRVGFVDFQGMRTGTLYYDLASLLFDPYVPITVAERDAMLLYYHELGRERGVPWEEFRRLVQIAGCQRLMQALGAYGFLSLVKNRRVFLSHVPRGLLRLGEAVDGAGPYRRLVGLVARCGESVARNPLFGGQ